MLVDIWHAGLIQGVVYLSIAATQVMRAAVNAHSLQVSCCLCKCRVVAVVSGQASRDVEQPQYDTFAHCVRQAPLHAQQP
jgi:hypothetical protein